MKTITKKNCLKLAMMVMALSIFTGASGQILTDYSETNAVDMYQTIDLNFRVYVDPDRVYSPDYEPVDNSGINPDSYWTFTITGGLTLVTPADISDPVNQNWVEVRASTIAEQTITAAESFGAAGCEDATPQEQTVHVVGEPSGVLIGQGTGTWEEMTAEIEFFICGDNVTDDLQLTFSEEGGTFDEFAYNISVERQGFDVNDDPVGSSENMGTISVSATDAGFVASGSTVGTGAMEFADDEGTSLRTRYIFTLESVASRTSTVSHYRAGLANEFYPVIDQTVTYWLNLPPVTGPIYHIPDNFSL